MYVGLGWIESCLTAAELDLQELTHIWSLSQIRSIYTIDVIGLKGDAVNRNLLGSS